MSDTAKIKIAVSNRRPTLYLAKVAGQICICHNGLKEVTKYEHDDAGQLTIYLEPKDVVLSPYPWNDVELMAVGFTVKEVDKKDLDALVGFTVELPKAQPQPSTPPTPVPNPTPEPKESEKTQPDDQPNKWEGHKTKGGN